jgi:phage terminase Nu1 subunit (DNA packaging protein)
MIAIGNNEGNSEALDRNENEEERNACTYKKYELTATKAQLQRLRRAQLEKRRFSVWRSRAPDVVGSGFGGILRSS